MKCNIKDIDTQDPNIGGHSLVNNLFCGICLPIELPWDEPVANNKEYVAWINSKLNRTPWIKIDSKPLGDLAVYFVIFSSSRHVTVI